MLQLEVFKVIFGEMNFTLTNEFKYTMIAQSDEKR